MNSKALEGVHQQTILGAILTLVTAILVVCLIFSELSTFYRIETASRMDLDKGASREAVKLVFDVTFPFVACDQISYFQEVTKGMIHFHEKQEIIKAPINVNDRVKGCSVTGAFLLDKVAGNFRLGIEASKDDVNYDIIHTISTLNFVPTAGPLLDGAVIGVPAYFNRSQVNVANGTAVYQYNLLVVPTEYKSLYGKLSFINQYTVSEKVVSRQQIQQSDFLSGLPPKEFVGLMFSYDFNPVTCCLICETFHI